MFPLPIFGGIALGWTLGANDAANVFGVAVASRIISFRRACILCSLAVIAGALLQGQAGIATLGNLSGQTVTTLVVTSSSAALTILLMTIFRLPISASQAMVGAIVGVGMSQGTMQWHLLQKIVICWIATPVSALLIACIVYRTLALVLRLIPMGMLSRDKILWSGLLLAGIYGAYALGANNVANATGIFSGKFSGINDSHLALLGGLAIALGVITYSKRIMLAVGSGIMPMDAFTSLVAVSAMSITVHIFALIGVPVSTSQGIVGAIIGIGFMQGASAIHFKTLRNIAVGWLLTPTIALILAAAALSITSGIVGSK